MGPKTFAAAFGGLDAAGIWQFCVGDAHATSIGTVEYWRMDITTLGGSLAKESGTNLALVIPDNGYDGSLNSMTCHSLAIP